LLNELILQKCEITVVTRNKENAKSFSWHKKVSYIECDLHINPHVIFDNDYMPDVIIHLAWSGLPNYNEFFHINKNFFHDLEFLSLVVNHGVQHIMVAGTCLEYGMISGELTEETDTNPITAYGIAKDSLRRCLELMQRKKSFTFQWIRIFYLYGEGQHPNSLLASLDRAIKENQKIFDMSMGDQIRDYLSVEQVAKYFVLLLKNPQCNGIINCCSGIPVSVFDFVYNYCRSKSTEIYLNRGHYQYPDYEPLNFWGYPAKLLTLKT
jgi:dTDP-6-deoxy-L-talose 4-dehydrogenase (NAD+)